MWVYNKKEKTGQKKYKLFIFQRKGTLKNLKMVQPKFGRNEAAIAKKTSTSMEKFDLNWNNEWKGCSQGEIPPS